MKTVLNYFIILGLMIQIGCGGVKKPPLKAILPAAEQPGSVDEIAWGNLTLRELKERLYSNDAEQRVLVADRLIAYDSKKSLKILREALQSDRPEVVQSILKVLALYQNEIFLEPVLDVLETKNDAFQNLIFDILSNFNGDELAVLLLKRLAIVEKPVPARQSLIRALGYTKSKQAVAPLIGLLNEPSISNELFAEAHRALEEITRYYGAKGPEDWSQWWLTHQKYSRERWLDEAVLQYQQSLKEKNVQVQNLNNQLALLKIDLLKIKLEEARKLKAQESELSLIRSALTDEYTGVQKYAIEQLRGQPKDKIKDLLPRLIEIMNGAQPEIRSAAVITLGEIGDEAVIDNLIALLSDVNENVEIRKNAAGSLGKIGSSKALTTLTYLLKENNTPILLAIIDALGKIRDKESVPVLIECLQAKNKPDEVQQAIIEVLGDIKDPQSLDVIIEFLKDSRKPFRWSAARSLGKIGDSRAVEPLIKLLDDEFADIRQITAEMLGQIEDKSAAPALIKMLLNDKDSRARELAAIALGKIKDAETVSSLLPSLNDPDEKVIRAVWNSVLLIVNDDIETGEKTAVNLVEIKQLSRAADLYKLLLANPKFQPADGRKEFAINLLSCRMQLGQVLLLLNKPDEAVPYLQEVIKEIQNILTDPSLLPDVKEKLEKIKTDCEALLKNLEKKPE